MTRPHIRPIRPTRPTRPTRPSCPPLSVPLLKSEISNLKSLAHYTPRACVERLVLPTVVEPLRAEWESVRAASLDPARRSDDVTLAVSGHLAELAKSLEGAGHTPRAVADFLTRCLFCMFAEDVSLLPERSFTELLGSIPPDGSGFQELLEQLFRELDTGTGNGISIVLRKKLFLSVGLVRHVLPVRPVLPPTGPTSEIRNLQSEIPHHSHQQRGVLLSYQSRIARGVSGGCTVEADPHSRFNSSINPRGHS